MKVALILEIDEDKNPSHSIREVIVTNDGEIQLLSKGQTMDVWILGMLSAIIKLIQVGHAAGLIEMGAMFKECIKILEKGTFESFPYWIKYTAGDYKDYEVNDARNIFSDPISLSHNETSFIYNLIHQKPHFNEQEAEMAKVLFEYLGFDYKLLPEKVKKILDRMKDCDDLISKS